MIAMLIIGIIIAIAYPLYWICIREIIPTSLTNTYELLGSKGWILQGYIALVVLTIFPSWLLISENNSLLCITSVCGMLMAANKIDGKAHIMSVVISCLSALLWLILGDWWIVLAATVSVGLVLGLRYGKWLLWCELAMIYSVILSIILN